MCKLKMNILIQETDITEHINYSQMRMVKYQDHLSSTPKTWFKHATSNYTCPFLNEDAMGDKNNRTFC